MPIVNWSSFQRSWTPRECVEVRPFEIALNTDLVRVPRGKAPVPIKSWSGPPTDRAQLLIRQIQAADFPFTVRVELGVAFGDVSEPWVRLAGGAVFTNATDAAYWRPFGVTGGVLTPRWTLSASLDPLSGIESIQCVFELFVDRGVAPVAPFTSLATGIVP